MPSLGEQLAGAYDPMGNYTGGATPVQYPSTGASAPGTPAYDSGVGDYFGALARLPVKAAMAIPDLAQQYGAWRTGVPAGPPYSTQAEDGLMAHGLLPQRTGSYWDQKGDEVASAGSNVMPGPGEAVSLAKTLGAAAGAATGAGKAIFVPLAMARRGPANASKLETMLAQGLDRDAWTEGRSWRDGITGVFNRPDGVPALETTDYAMNVARGKMQSQANKIANDGVPSSSYDTKTLYPYSQPLSDVVTSDAIRQVPELNDWRIVGMPHAQNLHGFANPSAKLIAVAADDPAKSGGKMFYDSAQTRNTVAHEMQHAVDTEAQAKGLPIFANGANSQLFPASSLSTIASAAHGTGSADGQRLSKYIYDTIYDPNGSTYSAPFRFYQQNMGEALARVVGETAATPALHRDELLKFLPQERMANLREGPMSPDKLHMASSAFDFADAVKRLQAGDPNALHRIFPAGQ